MYLARNTPICTPRILLYSYLRSIVLLRTNLHMQQELLALSRDTGSDGIQKQQNPICFLCSWNPRTLYIRYRDSSGIWQLTYHRRPQVMVIDTFVMSLCYCQVNENVNP